MQEADGRWVDVDEASRRQADEALSREVEAHYPRLGPVVARLVYSSVHDVAEVVADGQRYALKLYRRGVRSAEVVRWEIALHDHLHGSGAPVASLVRGDAGFIERLSVGGVDRSAVMARWAAGRKPPPTTDTYRLVGRAAAAIHCAADEFETSLNKRPRDLITEVHEQTEKLRPALEEIGRWKHVAALAASVSRFVSEHDLERGICHNDLTLDNVHISDGTITVFDFDSAGEHWRAAEPQGVFHYAVLTDGPGWDAWRAGYTELRTMDETDERAVPWFVLMSQFEIVAWKLGLTPTSVGPLLSLEDLPGIIDGWVAWAETQCAVTDLSATRRDTTPETGR